MKQVSTALKNLLSDWEATGRVYFVYPKHGLVSLNGGRLMNYEDATKYLYAFFGILDVNPEIIATMKARLAQPKFVGPVQPEPLSERA